MNSASGPDTPNGTVPSAPSLEQQSKESSPLIIKPEEMSLSSKLPEETGGLVKIKKSIKSELVTIAEDTSNATLSAESRAILERFVDNASRGFVSVTPMKCQGMKCPYINSCPLKQAGSVLPIGKRCPVEDTIATLHVTKHLQSLGIEDVNDPSHSFDMDMLCEIAGLELLRWRCGAELSKDGRLIIDQAVGGTMDGDIIYQQVVNPIIDVLDRTGKHISKLREGLIATRKAQAEAGHVVHDVSQKASDLRAKADAARRKRLEKIKEAEFTVKDDGEPNK